MPLLSTMTATDKPEEFEARAAIAALSVAALARARLEAQPYRQLRAVHCEYHQGLLTLRGSVASFYLKQMALAAVAGLDGVREIANRLEVRYTP